MHPYFIEVWRSCEWFNMGGILINSLPGITDINAFNDGTKIERIGNE